MLTAAPLAHFMDAWTVPLLSWAAAQKLQGQLQEAKGLCPPHLCKWNLGAWAIAEILYKIKDAFLRIL